MGRLCVCACTCGAGVCSQGMYIQCDLALVHQVTNVESNNYVKQDRGLHGCVRQVAQ